MDILDLQNLESVYKYSDGNFRSPYEACKVAAIRCKEFPEYKVTIYYDKNEERAVDTFVSFSLEYAKENNDDIRVRVTGAFDTPIILYRNNSYILIRPIGTFSVEKPNFAIYPESLWDTPLSKMIRHFTQPYVSFDGFLKIRAGACQVLSWNLDEECTAFQKSPELDSFLDSFRII